MQDQFRTKRWRRACTGCNQVLLHLLRADHDFCRLHALKLHPAARNTSQTASFATTCSIRDTGPQQMPTPSPGGLCVSTAPVGLVANAVDRFPCSLPGMIFPTCNSSTPHVHVYVLYVVIATHLRRSTSRGYRMLSAAAPASAPYSMVLAALSVGSSPDRAWLCLCALHKQAAT